MRNSMIFLEICNTDVSSPTHQKLRNTEKMKRIRN